MRDRIVAYQVGGKIVTIDVQSQDLSQHRVKALPVAAGNVARVVVAAAAISRVDIQVAVPGAEAEPTAVVISLRLAVRHNRGEARAGHIGVAGRHRVFPDVIAEHGVGVGILSRKIDVKLAVGGVVGVKRHPQQAAFAAGGDARDRQKRRRLQYARCEVENPDRAAPLHDEQPRTIARRVRDEQWRAKPRRHPRQPCQRAMRLRRLPETAQSRSRQAGHKSSSGIIA